MPMSLALDLAALATLLPATVLVRGRPESWSSTFWALLGVAAAGPAVIAVGMVSPTWSTGLSIALWVSIAATLVLYLALCIVTPVARRLAVLLLPYSLALGLIATLFHTVEGATLGAATSVWVAVHIAVSVLTYALITLAALSGLAAFLKARSLKAGSLSVGGGETLAASLPSVWEAERLQFNLLVLAELVLGAGVASGMALQYYETGAPLALDHKSILSLATFAVLGGLLAAHRWFGVGGRVATRVVLLAFLLITLAYPGVKFVSDVLL